MGGLMAMGRRDAFAWKDARTGCGRRFERGRARRRIDVAGSSVRGSSLLSCAFGDGIGPRVVAGFAEPIVGGLNGFEDGVGCAAMGAGGEFVLRRVLQFAFFLENVLPDWLLENVPCVLKLIGCDDDLGAGCFAILRRSLNPTLESGCHQDSSNRTRFRHVGAFA